MALSGNHQSFWIASTLPSEYPQLTQDIAVDVAIIGAGLVGVTVAKLLKQAGKTVALIEADRVGRGASGHTTAKVTSLHQLIYSDLVTQHGEDKARRYGESNQAAVEKLAALVQELGIDCDFERKAAYSFAQALDHLEQVREEAETAQRLGLPATFTRDTELPFEVMGAVKFSDQAQFHPRKFMLAIAAMIPGEGSHLFEQTRVRKVEGESPSKVITNDGPTITAQDVIIATHLPILDQGLFFAKTYPQRSYIVGARIDSAKAIDGMYIGVGESYRSLRTTPTDDGGTLLLMGGEGHKVGEDSDTEIRYQRLEADMQRYFDVVPDYRWSSQGYKSFDKLPYVGALTPANSHILVATGFSLWGMSKSIMAAMMLCDQVLGIDNPWASLYDATRPTPFVTQTSLKQNLDVGTRWVGDRLKGLFDSPKDLPPGKGKLVTVDAQKVAAYRDEAGDLHAVSAVCPHLGCIVAWNSAEKSWDCPCHGSRFSCDGEILHGPAVNPLEQR
ncbi:MAG: FAD-dependent oxidoreductase [Elainellaceae cyanobacterium]